MPDQLPADPMPDVRVLDCILESVLGTPCPDTFDDPALWAEEVEKARRHIAYRFDCSDWPAEVERFRRQRFIGGREDDGTPICEVGCRVQHLADHRARREVETAEAERRRPPSDPRVMVEETESAAAFCKVSARENDGDWGRVLRERAIRLSMRARIGRARLAVRRLVPTSSRPRAREHRATRRRSGRRAPRAALAGGDPGPEPEPREGDR